MGHIWLIGMMGTGKTTVGALVAQKLVRPFVDLDTEIMVATGKTIPDLFAEGEPIFRAAEAQVLGVAAGGETAVISTGGGAILSQSNLDAMKDTGVTVLLTASVATIAKRIGDDDDRPLAQGDEALTAIADLRMATYLAASDYAVDTEGKSAGAVVEEVLACLPT
jgi:shikimate kinase